MTLTGMTLFIYRLLTVDVFREQVWLEEKKEVLSAVTERVVTLREENEKLSEHR